jgi:hypothetical protein
MRQKNLSRASLCDRLALRAHSVRNASRPWQRFDRDILSRSKYQPGIFASSFKNIFTQALYDRPACYY